MNIKNLFLAFFILVSLLLSGLIVYVSVRPNYDDDIPVNAAFMKTPPNDTFDFLKYLKNVPADSIQNRFPYAEYLNAERFKDIGSVRNDLAKLDLIYPENTANRNRENVNVFYMVLADSLYVRRENLYRKYDATEYMKLLQWAEGYRYAANLDVPNANLYKSVSDYWMDTIVSRVSKLSYENPDIKYDFRYRYIKSRLNENIKSFSIRVTSFEKFLDNLARRKYSHLINATWAQASAIQKMVFILFLILTPLCYIITLVFILKKLKTKSNK